MRPAIEALPQVQGLGKIGVETKVRTGGGAAAQKPPAGRGPPTPISYEIYDGEPPVRKNLRLMRRAGKVGWHLLIVFLPILILTTLAVGLGYVRLMHGPISLKPLAGPIARGLGAELPGLDILIADVVVRLAANGSLEFRLKDVRLVEHDGDLVASAPEAAAQISADGLWSGRVVPSRIDLIEPKLNFSISEQGGVSLMFAGPDTAAADDGSPATDGAKPTSLRQGAAKAPVADRGPVSAQAAKSFDLTKTIADVSRRARNSRDGTSYLREIRLRNAAIVIDNSGLKTHWRVPEASVDLEHKKRSSVIAGTATMASPHGPWTIAFRTEESEKTKTVVLKTTVRDLVPKALDGGLPGIAMLQAIDAPIGSDATIEMTSDGVIRSAAIDIEVGPGRIHTPRASGSGTGSGVVSGASTGFTVDGGLLKLGYDAAARRLELAPSVLRWGGSQVTLKGGAIGGSTADGRMGWAFDLSAVDGSLLAADLSLPPLPLERWTAAGHWLPEQGRLQFTSFNLRAGGADLTGNGEIDTANDRDGMRFEARAGPMPLETFKTLWPRSVAPAARGWVGQRLLRANVKNSAFTYVSGSHAKDQAPADAKNGHGRLTMAIEVADVAARPLTRMSPIEAPKALVRIENQSIEINVPDAVVAIAPARRIPIKGGRFAVADLGSFEPKGEVTFKVQSPLGPVLEFIDQEPLALLQKSGQSFEGMEGKVDGQFRFAMPMVAELSARDVSFEGKVRVFDARAKQAIAGHDVQGATVTFDIAEHAVDAKGEMLVAGVLAKIGWQHIFDADSDKQPPLRITATLDNSDRNQLGLDLNHIVQGIVPVEITVTKSPRAEPAIRVRADLTNAEVALDALAWKKQPGRSAHVQFDVAKGKAHKTDLQNFKIAGDDVAVEGTVSLGTDNRPREFSFPDFTLNVITRLDLQGKITQDNMWDVKARGTTVDGRDFFRSLFSVGQSGDRPQRPQKPRDGVDIEADIDTLLGFSDTSLKGLKLKLSNRGGRLVSMEAKGTLDGGNPLVAVVQNQPKEPRRLLADSTDAGRAFKLVGFYPNLQGGRARLEVNLDGKGPAEKTGILWVDDFVILGDPVVAEVVGSVGAGSTDTSVARAKQKVVREAFQFDRMKAPFSVGHGQFVLDDSYLKGPILGANIRGKVDYRAKTVNLGGTYVPLQGLNNILGDIPLLGQILSGPRSEGIFGITFLIQGSMANPQVIVNPLSLLTPGITREILQMTPTDPSVQVREERKPAPAQPRTRASSTPADAQRTPAVAGPDQSPAKGPSKIPIDGWSSETKESPAQKRK